jgi:ADP-ribose pyrophosphatase YjhB (NUDIX family)
VNKEVNNGRGPVDFKISMGLDQTLVEFKLASNTKLKANLERQVDVYAQANHDPKKIVVIVFFNEKEEARVKGLLKQLGLHNKKYIVLIDARSDNKVSASLARMDNLVASLN